MHACVCVCMLYVCRYMQKLEENVRSQELELQVVVSHLVLVLGTKLGSSGRKSGDLNCGAISTATQHVSRRELSSINKDLII